VSIWPCPALRAISRYLNILRAGYGLYAIVRSSSSPLSSSVRSSRLSILCPWTVPCHRRKVVRASILPSKMYLPGSSQLCVEIEIANRNARSAHDRLYQNRSVHHNVFIGNHSGLCRSHWATFSKFTEWMHLSTLSFLALRE